MYRAGLRSSPRALRAIRPTANNLTSSSRRFLTTAPADKRRTWKGFAARWAVAIGALYWYNTSPIFADEPLPRTVPPPSDFSDSDLPTVEAVIEQKRRETRVSSTATAPPTGPQAATEPASWPQTDEPLTPTEAQAGLQPGSPEDLEEEAGQQGAFNPETGEINWDCPCLGGMAHGPCGEEFKAAFSCFVYSTEEPKGMDCIDKFQHMQDCFRQYPDIYGAELQDDDEEGTAAPVAGAEAAGPGDVLPESSKEVKAPISEKVDTQPAAETQAKIEQPVPEQKKSDVEKKEDEPIPKAAVDATDANKGKKES